MVCGIALKHTAKFFVNQQPTIMFMAVNKHLISLLFINKITIIIIKKKHLITINIKSLFMTAKKWKAEY